MILTFDIFCKSNHVHFGLMQKSNLYGLTHETLKLSWILVCMGFYSNQNPNPMVYIS